MGIGIGVVAVLVGLLLALGPIDLPGPLDAHGGWILVALGFAGILIAYARHSRRYARLAAEAQLPPPA